MDNVGVGIIGSGFMGRTYAETISRNCPQGSLRAVTGGSRAAELAKDYQIDLEPSVDSLVNRDDVSAVFITTPHHLHAEASLAAAAAGKHLMIEKPMACTVADCDAIIEARVAYLILENTRRGQKHATKGRHNQRLRFRSLSSAMTEKS